MGFFCFPGRGFEPRYHPPEGCVLPLDDPGILHFGASNVPLEILIVNSMRVSGRVIKGDRQATRDFGVPTANLAVDHAINFAPGSYVARVLVGAQAFDGLLYLHSNQLKIEVHLFDFADDLYGQELVVDVGEKIADPVPFESVEQMKAKIQDDVRRAKALLNHSSL